MFPDKPLADCPGDPHPRKRAGGRRSVRVVGVATTALALLSCAGVASAEGPDNTFTVGVPRMASAGAAWAGIVDFQGPGGRNVLSEQLVAAVQPNQMNYARFGSAVLVEDLDGDTYRDLIVGAPGYPGRTGSDGPGRVDVLFGTATGITAARALTLTAPALAGDEFGSALSLSTRASDGTVRDLWVGAPGHDVRGEPDAGAVFRYAISASGTATYLSTITQASRLVSGNAEAGDRFGAVLSGRSNNGTVVGVPNEDVGSLSDAGIVQRLRTDRADDALIQATNWSQNTPGVPGDAEAGDRFGAAVAWGAAVVGVPGEDVGRIKNAGLVQLFRYAGTDSLVPSIAYSQNSRGVPGDAEAGDQFGAAVSHGIFQCHEQTSAAVGAPGENIGRIKDAGSVTLILETFPHGPTLSDCPAQVFRQGHGLPGEAEAGDRVGASMGVRPGDSELEEDQTDTVLIGAPFEDVRGVYDAGRVIFGTGRWAGGFGFQGGPAPGMRFGSILPS